MKKAGKKGMSDVQRNILIALILLVVIILLALSLTRNLLGRFGG